MGPRLVSRGYKSKVAWTNSLLRFNGAAACEPRIRFIREDVIAMFSLLQWGRGL